MEAFVFTGIIDQVGTVKDVVENPSGKELIIQISGYRDVIIGESIAVNGVCLTVEKIIDDLFYFTAVHLTLEKTNLGVLKSGKKVNTERALLLSETQRLSGHIVLGHVNTTAHFFKKTQKGENYEMEFSIPMVPWRRYFLEEGSVTLNGASLTLQKILNPNEHCIEELSDQCIFMITIIPHTMAHTNFSEFSPGDLVNIEVDVLMKYFENFQKYS